MRDGKLNHEQRGEFRGDFTRDTFDPLRHFSRVLMQQGRVQLDADWNEQVSIFIHYMRSVVRDIGSEHWGPADDAERGFGISINIEKADFQISPGRYYVQGKLCEVDGSGPVFYSTQPDYPLSEEYKTLGSLRKGQEILVYLDVWERHLSYVEDDYTREVALGGPDTASRAKIIWQVKLMPMKSERKRPDFKEDYQAFLDELGVDKKPGSGRLRARARKADNANAPCLTSPESRYRGAENQLYRVEIHQGGTLESATFKWSRDNGSVIFPIQKVAGDVVSLEHTGRDSRSALKPNDWVEVVDDDYILQNRADSLLQVIEIDHENLQVTLSGPPTVLTEDNKTKHPYIRRWDQRKGDSAGISASTDSKSANQEWITLEDGIEIQFQPYDESKNRRLYHTGDYWLIPARTATGDVEWPGSIEEPAPLNPHGVVHHYAPLAIFSKGAPTDLRRKLKKSWS